ncbi:hypothetical protein [Ralstonia pseudosolanacearum]|nr:hypothetical protein [Ralstonia pseudosolanacearum]MDO3524050.1 hypothetical protein [Ralstonia pseudosolanacearum]MDO3544969.1 hypothetical protein [Ralstonia pseudosolanacearum]MDO3553456.1 hypothetical protein [Ralstonia pseudosolanacearum]MDO3567413.1 hypothetical protein [Ralstonia pseudosolanacearum]MDO3582905.1 hypothetical protein [Ralstonia pseudosolanacearum]
MGTQAGGTQGAVIAPMRECGLVNCGGYGKALLNPVKRQCGFRCAHHQYVRALRQDEIGNQALDRRFRKKYRVAANATHAGNPMSESGLKKQRSQLGIIVVLYNCPADAGRFCMRFALSVLRDPSQLANVTALKCGAMRVCSLA